MSIKRFSELNNINESIDRDFNVQVDIPVPKEVVDQIIEFAEKSKYVDKVDQIGKEKLVKYAVETFIEHMLGYQTHGYFDEFDYWFNDSGSEIVELMLMRVK